MKSIAVILAGGIGEKFWPRSVGTKPKQFNHILGEGSMLYNTFSRLKGFYDYEDIYIITNREFFDLVNKQIPEIPKGNIILEPFGRNTAPAIMLTKILLEEKYGNDCVIAAFPADHVISNEREFQTSVELACSTAHDLKKIAIIGIEPNRPETQYGYIQIDGSNEELGEYFDQGVKLSRTFAEKPDVNTAKLFIEAGDFLWNSGIFCCRFDVFAQNCKQYLPFHYQKFTELQQYIGTGDFIEELSVVYKQINSISLDYGILEKSEHVLVIEASFAWSDLVTWDEFYRLSMKDGNGNVIEGDAVTVETNNCLILTHDRLVGVAGVDDLIIIDSEDSLLICKRSDSGKVQEIVDFLKRKQLNKFL